MRFGDRLKKLRREKDISQKELGDILNISRRVIGYYESNDRFPKDEDTIKSIADFFNVTIDYLLGRTDRKEVAIIENEEIPQELRDIGVEYLEVNRELKEKGFTPKQILELIESLEKAGLLKDKK